MQLGENNVRVLINIMKSVDTQKGKVILMQAWTWSSGFQELEATRFQESRYMKVVRSSVLRTGHLYPQEIFLVLIFVRG